MIGTGVDLDLDNPAWRFALGLSRQEGVAAECLHVQDATGLEVSLLLVGLWLGAERGIALTPADLVSAEAVAGPWRRMSVERLRAVRRDLTAALEIGHAAVASLRQRVQAIEIDAEQIETALLYAWASRFATTRPEFGPRAARHNLQAVLEAADAPPNLDTPRLRTALRILPDDDGPDLACRDA